MLKVSVKNPMSTQFQMEYAMYMMLGSYFKKATCTSKRIEEKLFLHYKDLSDNKQVKLEEEVITLLEKKLLPALNIPGMENKEVTIGFLPREFGNIIILRGDGIYSNIIIGRENGKLSFAFIRNLEAEHYKKRRAS